jgi:hypothetical protein
LSYDSKSRPIDDRTPYSLWRMRQLLIAIRRRRAGTAKGTPVQRAANVVGRSSPGHLGTWT